MIGTPGRGYVLSIWVYGPLGLTLKPALEDEREAEVKLWETAYERMTRKYLVFAAGLSTSPGNPKQ